MKMIEKVAVIGSGVMGAGIAAQVANAGVPVLLLDIVPEGASNRNAVAEGAVAKLLKADPAPFMSPKAAGLIETGNIEDDLGKLATCDLIIEVVIERLDIKQALYHKIEAVRRPGTPVSSNTSTIPLKDLIKGLPARFARDFSITHFFNPPRYMQLLELVTGPETDLALVAQVTDFIDRRMGKTVVETNDSPGFIANRLGAYWLQRGLTAALDGGLTVEDADAIASSPMGVPKTGVFGLLDLIGIDLIPQINASLARALPPEDVFHAANRDVPLIARMVADGYTGRKGKGGFYRLNRAGGAKVKESLDLATGDYHPAGKPGFEDLAAASKTLKGLFEAPGKVGTYAWTVMGLTLSYAVGLVGDAANDIVAIDEAMRLGYNWRWGPFELIDKVGAGWLADRLTAEGWAVPALLTLAREKGGFYRIEDGKRRYLTCTGDYQDIVRPAGVLLLEDLKLSTEPVLKNRSASVWDIGDGVLCFEFTSKGNALDEEIITLLGKTLKRVEKTHKALVIYTEGRNFSVGANLGHALFAANIAAWGEIETMIASGQTLYKAIKYAPFPVVSAPSGMALGGGCEILLHSAAVQAHAESYIGLVECGVGVIPAWGGCKEMLARWTSNPKHPKGVMPGPAKVFEIVSTATVAKSAADAMGLLFLRPTDGITMNRRRLLADAKATALALADGYTPPEPRDLHLPGPSGRYAMNMAVDGFQARGLATDYDVVVASELANVLSGGDTDLTEVLTEDQLFKLEREAFMRLVKQGGTLDRIEHMLETGKPLRN